MVVGGANSTHSKKALDDIEASIIVLTATVECLVALQQEAGQGIYPNQDNDDDDILLLGQCDRASEDSLYAPSRPKSQHTSMNAEGLRAGAYTHVGPGAYQCFVCQETGANGQSSC